LALPPNVIALIVAHMSNTLRPKNRCVSAPDDVWDTLDAIRGARSKSEMVCELILSHAVLAGLPTHKNGLKSPCETPEAGPGPQTPEEWLDDAQGAVDALLAQWPDGGRERVCWEASRKTNPERPDWLVMNVAVRVIANFTAEIWPWRPRLADGTFAPGSARAE
jgi:hypothetical protein